MNFNIGSLGNNASFYIVMAILLITLFLNKLLPVQWFLRHFPQRQRWAGGFLLSSRLSLMIAAGQIGRQAGLITLHMSNMFVLLAIGTCILGPAAFNHLIGKVHVQRQQANDEGDLGIGQRILPEGWVARQIEVCSDLAIDLPLRSFHLPPDLLIVSIIRGNERIAPRGHTKLEQFDVLQVIGTPEQLDRLDALFV